MLTPNNPTDIDQQPTGLDYWVKRCCNDQRRDSEFHLRYRGASLVVHPTRAAMVTLGDRRVFVEHDRKRHAGRQWLPNLCEDIEKAITTVAAGGGSAVQDTFGDLLRNEMARRKGTGQREPEAREHWMEWAQDDELPLLMGSWMHQCQLVRGRYEISRRPVLDFHPTNEEFEMASLAHAGNMFIILKRLIRERMLRAGALTEGE